MMCPTRMETGILPRPFGAGPAGVIYKTVFEFSLRADGTPPFHQ